MLSCLIRSSQGTRRLQAFIKSFYDRLKQEEKINRKIRQTVENDAVLQIVLTVQIAVGSWLLDIMIHRLIDLCAFLARICRAVAFTVASFSELQIKIRGNISGHCIIEEEDKSSFSDTFDDALQSLSVTLIARKILINDLEL